MKNRPNPTPSDQRIDWSFLLLCVALGLLVALTANQYKLSQRIAAVQSKPLSYATAVNAAADAVISLWAINHEQSDEPSGPAFSSLPSLDPSNLRASQGSGIVVSDNGYVLTNYHVVQGADEVIARLPNGEQVQAYLVGSDPATDIAVLRIQANYPIPAIRFGADADVNVGDQVLAIGHPFDVGLTVTQGIVSAKSRGVSGFALVEEFIQTDAAINPGNSGGALVNSLGELIGLNTAVYQGNRQVNGISFAIPASTLRLIVDQIVEFGEVRRGWIGVQVSPISLGSGTLNAPQRAIVITGIYQNSPAAQAGLQVGDAITAINQVPVTSLGDLVKATWGQSADGKSASIELSVSRQGLPLRLTLTPRAKPQGIN